MNKKNFPLKDVNFLLDAGYDSGKNLSFLSDRKIDGYVANQMESVYYKEQHGYIEARPFTKDKFKYNAKDDYYECPAGKRLFPYRKKKTKMKTYTRNEVIYKGQECKECQFQKDCVKSKTGYREVKRFLEYDAHRARMDKKIATQEGKKILQHRSMDVEPTFGQMKLGILTRNPFLVKGQKKARGEFGLCCIVHNIKKISTYLKSIENPKNTEDLRRISLQLAI